MVEYREKVNDGRNCGTVKAIGVKLQVTYSMGGLDEGHSGSMKIEERQEAIRSTHIKSLAGELVGNGIWKGFCCFYLFGKKNEAKFLVDIRRDV